MGRKSIIDTATDDKILELASKGLTHEEIADYLGMNRRTIERYRARNKSFADRMDSLKDRPRLMAKMILADDLAKDNTETAKWVLERLDGQFKKSQDINISGGTALSQADTEALLNAMIKAYREGQEAPE